MEMMIGILACINVVLMLFGITDRTLTMETKRDHWRTLGLFFIAAAIAFK